MTRSEMRRGADRRWRVGAGLVLIGALVAAQPLLSANASQPPEPTYDTAVVDGTPSEWVPGDVFGALLSNDPPYVQRATASLRYDCATGILYVHVAALDGVVLQTIDPAEHYVRLGTGKLVSGLSGNDGTAPDFAWVGLSGDTASGWEASAPVAEGAYPSMFRIHAKVPDQSADGYEVLDLTPRYSDLTITCPDPETTTTETTTPTTETTTPTTETTTPTTETTTPTTETTTPTTDPVDPAVVKPAATTVGQAAPAAAVQGAAAYAG